MKYRPIVLAVLDGWGCREERHGNAIAAADLPNWRRLFEQYPHTTLCASGESVGLPKGIMGNSEVGHLNLGGGRVVPQGVTRDRRRDRFGRVREKRDASRGARACRRE